MPFRYGNKISPKAKEFINNIIDNKKEDPELIAEAGKDIVVDDVLIKGSTTTDGTGYSSFKDLVNAKKKKAGEVEASVRRSSGNFASLLGGDNRLG